MDIDDWIKNRTQGEKPTTQQTTQPCAPCPKCEEKMKPLRSTPEQLFYDVAHDGIVVNEEHAKAGPCKCVNVDGKDICWDHGIIGILSQEQATKYCTNKEEMKISKKNGKLIEDFQIASTECKVGKEYNGGKVKSIEDRIRCMYSVVGGDL